MKLVFFCESFSDPSCDFVVPSIDWVVVDLSPERMALLQQQIELANKIRQKDPTFSEMEFKMNEVQVYDHFPAELDGKAFQKAYGEACDRGWHPLADDLDLSRYQLLELKSERFCVRPAKGKRPATFRWLIHIEGEAGPGRTVKWNLADLEKALSLEGVAA
jgi:hypothetical protein